MHVGRESCLSVCQCLLVSIAGVTEPKEEEQHAGPAGGVQPGLPQDEGRGIEGPEPLMGVKRLDKLEQGRLVSGSTAVGGPCKCTLQAQWTVPPPF